MYSQSVKVAILAHFCMPEPGWPNMVKMRNWPYLTLGSGMQKSAKMTKNIHRTKEV